MMKYITAILAVLCLTCVSPLNGEEKPPTTGGPFEVAMEIPATKYWMYVPEDYTPNRTWPLVVGLHGSGDNARNFIQALFGPAQKNKFIIATPKSAGMSWAKDDERVILSVMKDVRKKYAVDPERTYLVGFSAGAVTVNLFGFQNQSQFRGLGMISGALPKGGYKEVKLNCPVFIVCGDKDEMFYPICEELYRTLDRQKVDTEFHIMSGMGHGMDSTAVPWVFGKFLERFNKPDDLLKRGKRAVSNNRYLDAIDYFNKVIEVTAEDTKENKAWSAQAQEELKKIDKTGSEKYSLALKKIETKNKDEGVKLLKEIVAQFEGLPVCDKAKQKLAEMETEQK
ncbi:MAG: PHB depolymerase family esterase [Planctomycetota bacterium]